MGGVARNDVDASLFRAADRDFVLSFSSMLVCSSVLCFVCSQIQDLVLLLCRHNDVLNFSLLSRTERKKKNK